MTTAQATQSTGTRVNAIKPVRMAHIVLKSKKPERLAAWYKTVFHAEELFSNDLLTFLTFDDEHHRFAIARIPEEFPDADPKAVGVAHFAYTYASIDDLVATYDRLKAAGIEPHWPVNHGMTVSMYYHDPDGNEIELQVDVLPSPEACKSVFDTDQFAANPIGNEYDPDVFSAEIRAGAPLQDAIGRAEAART